MDDHHNANACGPGGAAAAGAAQTWALEVTDLAVEVPRGTGGDGGARRRVLGGVSLRVARGETLGVIGRSGSGKTTLARAILGLVPYQGRVRVLGEPIGSRASRRRIQVVFQDPGGSLDPTMRVLDSVVEPMIVHNLGGSDAQRQAAALSLLERCGIDATQASRRPRALSGGQRQRVAIARALASEPGVVVCDESTSALDVSVQAQVLNLLSELQRERGLAYLLISHDLGVIAHMAPRVAVLEGGVIVDEGETDRVLGAAAQREARTPAAGA